VTPKRRRRAAQQAIQEATAVSRRKYETAARLVLGRALLQMKEHSRAEAELRVALAGAERLIHPQLCGGRGGA